MHTQKGFWNPCFNNRLLKKGMMCYFPRENSLYTLNDERPPGFRRDRLSSWNGKLYSTKVLGNTLPPTEHHSFFRNLPPLFIWCEHTMLHVHNKRVHLLTKVHWLHIRICVKLLLLVISVQISFCRLRRLLSYSRLYPQFKYMTFIYSQSFIHQFMDLIGTNIITSS